MEKALFMLKMEKALLTLKTEKTLFAHSKHRKQLTHSSASMAFMLYAENAATPMQRHELREYERESRRHCSDLGGCSTSTSLEDTLRESREWDAMEWWQIKEDWKADCRVGV